MNFNTIYLTLPIIDIKCIKIQFLKSENKYNCMSIFIYHITNQNVGFIYPFYYCQTLGC